LWCGRDGLTPLYESVHDRLSFAPGTWRFVRCTSCGSANLSPLPNESDLADFYPPLYSFTPDAGRVSVWRRAIARLEYQVFYRPMYEGGARRVLRHTLGGETLGKAVLDIGCGRGYRLLGLQQRGCVVTGTDFQPTVVNYVQDRLGIPARCCGIGELEDQFEPQSFDLVTAFYVLEHVLDVEQALSSCFKLLSPGGWLAAAVPLIDSLQAKAFGKRWSQVTEAPRHISLPSRRGVRLALEKVGFAQSSLRPDSLVNCAGTIGLSLVPGGATPHVYGSSGWRQAPKRCLAVASAVLALPWCVFENQFACRPGMGIVFAQRPGDFRTAS